MGAALPFVALAIWARLDVPGPWELEVVRAARAGEGLAGDALRLLTTLGDLAVWVAIAFGLTTAAVIAGRIWAGVLIALSVGSDLAAFVVKLLVERARPEGALVDVLFGGESFAFPSGHVVRATTLAAVVAWIVIPRRWRLPAAVAVATLVGAAMGWSRVAVGAHWPTDALGGLLLGICWFAATAWLVAPRVARRSSAT